MGDPVINYTQGEDVAVTLICQVPLLNGVEKWRNVTYKIEWYAEGKTLLTDEPCGNVPCGGENSEACPNIASVQSKLAGTKYKIGQSVSKIKELL